LIEEFKITFYILNFSYY